MARKRSRRRSPNPAPLLLIALLLAALVAWAVYPRTPRRRTAAPKTVAVATASPVPQPLPAHTPAPVPARPAPRTSAPASPAPLPSPSPAVLESPPPGGARVAIIIDDCGQWLDTEQALIKLPIPLTLAVLPDVHYTSLIAQEAAAAGKGVMLHLPMEPISHIYPGPGEIKDGMTDAQITRQTEADFAQVPLAKGVNNHEGSESTSDERVMKDVMAVIKAHGDFFIDSRTTAKTVAQQVAQEDGVPNARRNVFLDDKPDLAYTESMLEQAVELARRDGSAIAIGHPKPTTLEAIRALYPKMEAQGVTFVLAQQLVR